jgi:hypothetical protein
MAVTGRGGGMVLSTFIYAVVVKSVEIEGRGGLSASFHSCMNGVSAKD